MRIVRNGCLGCRTATHRENSNQVINRDPWSRPFGRALGCQPELAAEGQLLREDARAVQDQYLSVKAQEEVEEGEEVVSHQRLILIAQYLKAIRLEGL